MSMKFRKFPLESIRLLPGIFTDRAKLNKKYIMSLTNENLLRSFYFEAGLWHNMGREDNIHFGWEAPTCQIRGHFLGHWLSAAAQIYRSTQDFEVKSKADFIVSELARCQKENGSEWAGSIPEKYLDWLAEGKPVWVPQYTLHKTLMGLWDMYKHAGNSQAFEIINNWANWFYRWTGKFSYEQMQKILTVETGGMLEIWADLYGVTKKQEHLELLNRYYKASLFDELLSGKDVLTNSHANTTIPEALGAARAWEVTGDKRWKDITEAYWHFAVDYRGYFCTGGQTAAELWTPPGKQSARLSDKNQEHCTVYNMMRLAEIMLLWTGDASYADYWERNLYGGILSQQNPKTGMVTYFLPLQAGSVKKWGTPTEDFWCCHGTLVQAHSAHGSSAFLEDDDGLIINQYIPTEVKFTKNGNSVKAVQNFNSQLCSFNRPNSIIADIDITTEAPLEFSVKLRIPWWVKGEASVMINGEKTEAKLTPSSYYEIYRAWSNDRIQIVLPKSLYTCSLPDNPDMVAFMDGPMVLAGLCSEERILTGDKDHCDTILTPDDEREWPTWKSGYRTKGQNFGFKFIPLHEISDEKYQVYFSINDK